MEKDLVKLTLSHDEALVLLNWVARINDSENRELFTDLSEQTVLFNLEALLESSIPEVFDPKYDQLVDRAKSRLKPR